MPLSRFLRPLGLTAFLLGSALPAFAQDNLVGPYLAARYADGVGDYAAVVDYGARALARDPDNTGLMEGLILAQIGLGDIGAAVPVARRLIGSEAGNQVAGLVMLADAMERDDWDATLAILESGASVGGRMDDMIRAWAVIGQGKVSQALAIFDGLAGEDGGLQAPLLQKALALALVGDYEGAAEILGGEAGTLRLNRAGILAYVQVLSQLERNPDAVKLIDDVFGEGADEEIATLRAELAAGKPIPFTAVTGPREGLAQLFFEVGESLSADTEPALALIYTRIAEYLAPGHVGAILTSAQLLRDLGNDALAAETYTRIGPDDRAYPQAQLGRANALRAMGDPDTAIAVLGELATDYPDRLIVHAALGDALRFEKRYEEAIPHYDDAIALYGADEGQWGVYFARGVCLERAGRWPEAEADFLKALTLDPDQPSVLNYLGYSYVEKRENLDEALGMIERAVAGRPFDGYIRDSLGWVFYRLGRYEDAVEEMERAVELMPVDPVVNDHLGDTYWAVGRYREAEFQWKRALSFVTDDTDLDELNPDRIRQKLEVGLDKVLEEEGGEPIKR